MTSTGELFSDEEGPDVGLGDCDDEGEADGAEELPDPPPHALRVIASSMAAAIDRREIATHFIVVIKRLVGESE